MGIVQPNPTAPAFPMTTDQVRQQCRDAILAIALVDFRESPVFFGPETLPSTIADGAFSVLMQATTNTGFYRDRKGQYMRLQQDVTIRYAKLLRVNASGDQIDDLDTARGTHEPIIIKTLMGFAGQHMPGLSVEYQATDPIVVESGKWAIIDVQFSMEHNFQLAST